MRAVFALVCLAACGRIGFDPHEADDARHADASGDAVADATSDAPGSLHVVQLAMGSGTGSGVAVPIAPTQAGDLLVVGISQQTSAATVVSGAAAGADAFVSASARSVDSACNDTAEIWYAKNVQAGETSVNVNMSAMSTIEVWVLEVAGPTTLARIATDNDHAPSGLTIAGPLLMLDVPCAVIATVTPCGSVSQISSGNPFIALPIITGKNTAYYIASAPGTYGASWDYTGSTWNTSIAAFR